MGLDQFAKVTSRDIGMVDFFKEEDEERGSDLEIHYWRKHANLHGWMFQLYRAKGGQDEEFNLTPVQLTAEDLDRLERDTKADALPYTTGFFFGASQPEDYDDTLAFIKKARTALAAGEKVYYYAWF